MTNSISPGDTAQCSAFSLESGEQLYGTASRTDLWILIEYHEAIGAKALVDSSLSEELKSYLSGYQKSLPNTRILLIKKARQSEVDSRRVFICKSSTVSPRVYSALISDYDDLLEIDVKRFFSGAPDPNFELYDKPVFLVCTNGRRDPCCARWGVPVLNEASIHTGDNLWQTSHVGGHRFAANVICLPHGIYYGRVRPENVGELIDDYQQGIMSLNHYRGRSSYPPEAQAGEYFLQVQSSITDINAYRLDSIQTINTKEWEVEFLSNMDGSRFSVHLTTEPNPVTIFESCSKPDQQTMRLQFRLEGWSKL